MEEKSNFENIRKCVTVVIYDDMGKPFFLILKDKGIGKDGSLLKGASNQEKVKKML